MTVVSAEISADNKRVEVYFRFDWKILEKMKEVPGSHFVGKDKVKPPDVPHWTVPLDVTSLRIMRKSLGELEVDFRLGPKLRGWGHRKVRHGDRLRTLATADHATLSRVWADAPRLARALFIGPLGKDPEKVGYPNTEEGLDQLMEDMKSGTFSLDFLPHLDAEKKEALRLSMMKGSYQQADVAFMAMPGSEEFPHSPANFNQPGTGKTLELIGAMVEAGMEPGDACLISAPKTVLNTVWLEELHRWTEDTAVERPILVASEGRSNREALMRDVQYLWENDEGFFLVVNPDMLRCKKVETEGKEELIPQWPQLFNIDWKWFIVDEFHMCGLTNRNSLTRRSIDLLTSERRGPTSGTPIGGKAMKLWPVLNFCRPDEFTAEWRFADQWFEILGEGREQTVGDLREDRLDAFWDMLSQYAIRRTKEEATPWLLPKDHVVIKAEMDGQQEDQYEKFALAAEITIEEEHLDALGILAEYTRLKQFAQAACRIISADNKSGYTLLPKIETSCKLPHTLRIMEELGIKPNEMVGDAQVVIFSQFTRTVNALAEHLRTLGIPCETITGQVTQARRDELVPQFQGGQVRVLLMNTTAGGVGITLDAASTAIFWDETWNPDDQEQALDRMHRASKIHQVTGYYIRTMDTIETYIHSVIEDKSAVNYNILDARRLGLRATKKAKK